MISGSSALIYHDINLGEPKDIDIICTESMTDRFPGCDIIVVPQEIYDLLYNDTGVITLDLILTIKMSHLSWDVKWIKTKRHVNNLLLMGNKPDLKIYYILKDFWKTIHGNKDHLSLKNSKDEFFNDFVTYVVDHDHLHELVSYPNKPIYNKCLMANEEVLIDYNKFLRLSFDEQVRMFREEITVIAIERWLINPSNKGKYTWVEAYNLALQKTIVSLTKNWATDFIIHNLHEFSKMDYSYFKHALNTLTEMPNAGLGDTMKNEMRDKLKAKFELIYKDLVNKGLFDERDSIEELVFWMCEGDNLGEEISEYLNYEHLQQEGGGEGGSEYCYGVFRLGIEIYKAEYSYYSHNGCEYDYILDTLQEVKPVQKTITVYE